MDIDLKKSYKNVFKKYEKSKLFSPSLLEKSNELFNFNKNIIPKKFEVAAVLCGLPFSEKLQRKVKVLQNNFQKKIGTNKAYWVKQSSLGLELFVTKWPKDKYLKKDDFNLLKDFLIKYSNLNLKFVISGFQVHTDGCVVLKGHDNGALRKIRSEVMGKFNFIPRKQSKWVHIPIGRILTQLTKSQHLNVIDFCKSSENNFNHIEKISQIKYIHEYRWYMYEHKIVYMI